MPLAYMELSQWKQAMIDEEAVPTDTCLWKAEVVMDEDFPVKVVAAERQVTMTLSTGRVDRDNDTIDPKGWDIANYRKNPVVLYGHRFMDLPVGVATKIGKDKERLWATDYFPTKDVYPLSDTIYQFLTHDPPLLRTCSVGFRGKRHSYNEERGGFDFHQQELLEHSIVPIPSNMDALVEARSALGHDVMRPYVLSTELFLDESVGEEKGGWRKQLEEAYFASTGKKVFLIDGNVPKTKDAAAEEQTAGKVEEGSIMQPYVPRDVSCAKASNEIEWKKPTLKDFTDERFEDMSEEQKARIAGHFALVTGKDFSGLKLGHHDPATGQVAWEGVRLAMGTLLGARGGIDLPAEVCEQAYDHLAEHYRQYDLTAPEYRYVQAQVLKYLPEQYALDGSGQLVTQKEKPDEEKHSGFDINSLFTTEQEGETKESDALDIQEIARSVISESVRDTFRELLTSQTGRLD